MVAVFYLNLVLSLVSLVEKSLYCKGGWADAEMAVPVFVEGV
jgi:hypothetical protein